jgi:predicted lipoprotein
MLPRIIVAVGVVALLVAFPPFRVVRPGEAGATPSDGPEPFRAAPFATKFWDERLLKANAVDAKMLLAAIRTNPKAAKEKYGKVAALDGPYCYFVSGTGKVVSADANAVGLLVEGAGPKPDVVLEVGPIFGNTVRDATGLLTPADAPNSQGFNELSAELNKLVAGRVLPTLKEKAAVGTEVTFIGCAEITDEDTDLRPLRLVPVSAEVR